MTIIELREKRAKLWNAMEGFLDTHRTDKGVRCVSRKPSMAFQSFARFSRSSIIVIVISSFRLCQR